MQLGHGGGVEQHKRSALATDRQDTMVASAEQHGTAGNVNVAIARIVAVGGTRLKVALKSSCVGAQGKHAAAVLVVDGARRPRSRGGIAEPEIDAMELGIVGARRPHEAPKCGGSGWEVNPAGSGCKPTAPAGITF